MMYILYIAPGGRMETLTVPEDNRKAARQIRGRVWQFVANLPEGASAVCAPITR